MQKKMGNVKDKNKNNRNKNIRIVQIEGTQKDIIDRVVSIHLDTFQGFFLTFMGRGFLRTMYQSYCDDTDSGLLVALDDANPVGFLAYSGNLSGLYKYMIRKRLIPFAWYSIGAFCRKPAIFMRLLRAFLKPKEAVRTEQYIELASIGVSREAKAKGIGTRLIQELKEKADFDKYAYITLETDAVNNELVNRFYVSNGFVLERTFCTHEGRKMNEYRFGGFREEN